MLEDDVDVIPTGEFADAVAEALPFAGVLGGVVLPELVSLGLAIDDQFRAHRPAQIGFLRTGHHAHRDRATVDGVLGGIGTQAARGTPDQHHIALLHAPAVVGHQLAVGGGVDQPRSGCLLPGQVRRLGEQLVGLHQCDLGQAAEVRLEAPDALFGIHHRVVVAEGAFQLHAQAMGDDLVAGLPRVHARAGAQHDARGIGTDDVVGQIVPLGQLVGLAIALQEAEGRHRFEDRGPHGVVVDARGHDRDQCLTRTQFRKGHLVDVQGAARILVPGGHALEHVGLIGMHRDGSIGLGQFHRGDVAGFGPLEGGVQLTGRRHLHPLR